MRLIEPLLQELDREAVITRKVLARVPEVSLGWAPHLKSMTLGQLALHLATLPGNLARAAQLDVFEPRALGPQRQTQSLAELFDAFAASLADARHLLEGMSDRFVREDWTLARAGQPVLVMSRERMLRGILLNHWYHHRGQLTVYLRLLDVPLPAIYGATADEEPASDDEAIGIEPFDVNVPAPDAPPLRAET